MKTLCITGGNGLLGNKLLAAAGKHYRIFTIDLQPRAVSDHYDHTYLQGDITDKDQITELIAATRVDCVIHTAAFTDVDGCERDPDKAWLVNVKGTQNVVSACRKIGAKLIHLSTDFVFNGDHGPYDEEAEPDPINVYGKTKLDSEKIIQSDLNNWVIARTMILFGYAPGVGHNFVTWLVQSLDQGEKVNIVNDQFGTPTLADDLAQALLALLDEDAQGVYNTAGPELVQRHEFAQLIAHSFGFDESLIDETDSVRFKQDARRPLRSGLKMDKFMRKARFSFSTLRSGLEKIKRDMNLIKP
jgi:dTDP-4-dehydrorhamnose reductase